MRWLLATPVWRTTDLDDAAGGRRTCLQRGRWESAERMVKLCQPRYGADERKGKRMYIRIGNRIVNTEAMTDAEIVERPDGERSVVVTTTAVERVHGGSLASRRIMFVDEEAELFLSALPTYSPVPEPEPEAKK